MLEPSKPTVSEARLLSVLDTAADGIIVIDEHARILVFNKACEVLFGHQPQDVLGKNIKCIMPHQYATEHDTYLHNYITSGHRKIIGIGREVSGQHKDGTIFPLELSVGEAQTPDGRQFIGILRDLRARKEADVRLNQLQADCVRLSRVAAMDEMGAAIAHELNQPLTAMRLYMQSVSRMIEKFGLTKDVSAVVPIIDKALSEAQRASNIIDRVRKSVEQRETERRLVALPPLIEEAAELTMLGYINPPRIAYVFADNLPHVMVDQVQIQQVIVNLIRNALQAARSSAQPKITIQVSFSNDIVEIAVEDNGPGIPPEVMPSLFKAFASSRHSGMGVGLAISRLIAQNHGGDLAADAGGHDGRGARFFLRLPATNKGERKFQSYTMENVE